MPDQMVSLADECARIEELWQRTLGAQVPLSLAAAFSFQQLRDGAGADGQVSRVGYDNDLNLLAAALSRNCDIFSIIKEADGSTVIPVNLRNQRFGNGATQLHCLEDGFFFDQLSIRRCDVNSAIPLMRRAGLSLTCEFYPIFKRIHQHGQASG